jgi:hypothetical protein
MTWSAKLAPWLSAADAGRAVDFYKSAFGAVEPERREGDVGVLQVARLGIGEVDFWVQVDPGGNPHALGGSPLVRMVLAVDDPTPVGFRNPDVTLRPRSPHERDRRDNPASDRRRGGCGHARRGFFAARAWLPNHVEMLGLDPGRGPAGHTKTAGHPTPA